MAVLPAAAGALQSDRARRNLRLLIGWGCIAVWVLNTAHHAMPERFSWGGSLPLHFCNLANLFGAAAILKRSRLFRGILYFWALGLCSWAFLTPTLQDGPALPGFWIFWVYHLFIGLSLVYLLAVEHFRPTARDLRSSCLFTLSYTLLIALVDRLFDWNYGFLGPAVPDSPTPVDVLGPYPLRVVWMILIGAVVFAMLWLPFAQPSRSGSRPSESL
jgi:hypothetical integral membrane protein (TIGR02206 family)